MACDVWFATDLFHPPEEVVESNPSLPRGHNNEEENNKVRRTAIQHSISHYFGSAGGGPRRDGLHYTAEESGSSGPFGER
jgi:hypothetical protein